MTVDVDIVNRALSRIGTRTTVASLAENSNEAIQANLNYFALRDEIVRMAPWNFATNTNNLNLISAAPGTPENPITPITIQWQKIWPSPPWSYEYTYPSDCLRALWIIPQFTTGFAAGVPITTAVTGGGVTTFWNGPPVRYKVAVDQPITITAAAIAAPGVGYVVGDNIFLGGGAGTQGQLQVASVGGSGNITGVTIFLSGVYTISPANPVSQVSTTGSGTGATFNLTLSAAADRRVILTNQEFAALTYIKQSTDPNQWDPQFVEALTASLAGRLVWALVGSKELANIKLHEANEIIALARQSDGNEGLTINDVTPDWIRSRGYAYPTDAVAANTQFDWGPLLTMY